MSSEWDSWAERPGWFTEEALTPRMGDFSKSTEWLLEDWRFFASKEDRFVTLFLGSPSYVRNRVFLRFHGGVPTKLYLDDLTWSRPTEVIPGCDNYLAGGKRVMDKLYACSNLSAMMKKAAIPVDPEAIFREDLWQGVLEEGWWTRTLWESTYEHAR